MQMLRKVRELRYQQDKGTWKTYGLVGTTLEMSKSNGKHILEFKLIARTATGDAEGIKMRMDWIDKAKSERIEVG
jgi:hypothetical protein